MGSRDSHPFAVQVTARNALFKIEGKPVSLTDFARYDNPYCQSDFAANEIKVKRADQHLVLNLKSGTREVSEVIF